MLEFQKGNPLLIPLATLIIPRPEALSGFQLLRANIGMKGVNKLLNNIYNMVRLHNYQFVEEILLCLKEGMHHTNPKSNTVQEDISQRNQLEVSHWEVSHKYPSHQRIQKHQTHPPGPEG